MSTVLPHTDPPSSLFVVEASAGSGKTYALASRYLKLMLNAPPGEHPFSGILAITFMKKASLEMKARILELLKRLALDAFADRRQKEELLHVLGLDAATASPRAAEALRAILQGYNYFQVQTIDSFINALLVGCAFRLNLSANFRIKEEYADYLAYGLDRLIDQALAEPSLKDLFLDFLFHYLRVENRSGWLFRQDILRVMLVLFGDLNLYGVPFGRTGVAQRELSRRVQGVGHLLQSLYELAGDNEGLNKTFRNSLAKIVEKSAERFSFDLLQGSAYWGRPQLPLNKNGRVPEKVKRLWDELNAELAAVAGLYSRSLFLPYAMLFERVLQNMCQLTQKEDVLFLEELNRQARTLFDRQGVGLPEIYLRLATRFRHFLIDEFQDTAVLQWRNILPMVEDALAAGGSLFYVGDRKQAIYRFRGGAVRLFDEVQNAFPQTRPQQETLKRNYRSRQEIVAFNNELFSVDNLARCVRDFEQARSARKKEEEDISLAGDDPRRLFAHFSSSAQEALPEKQGGYIRVLRWEAQDEEESDERVRAELTACIAQLRGRGVSFRDIAILVRSNLQVEKISGWLIEAGIAVESEKTLDMRQNSCVKELVSFLAFLNSPIDELAFASFVTGALFCGAAGIPQQQVHDFLFERARLPKERRAHYLYRAFAERFPDAWEGCIAGFFRNVGFYPLYELLVSIVGHFGVLERFPAEQGFVMAFLELVKQKEEDYPSLGAFLDYFPSARKEELYVRMPKADAVRVTTIHKAKGLEFPVVILPYLQMRPSADRNAEEGAGRYHIEPAGPDEPLELLSLRPLLRRFDAHLQECFWREYVRSFWDELNSAYVACTRAQEELYIFLASVGSAASPGTYLIPAGIAERGRPSYRSEEVAAHAVLPLEPPRYRDWLSSLSEEFVDERSLSLRKRQRKGELMHALLAQIGDLSGKDVDAAFAAAVERVRLRFAGMQEFDACLAQVRALIGDERLRPFFFCAGKTVFTEQEVVGAPGLTRRIDRLIVERAGAVVVDYKSHLLEGAEQEAQVREYLALVAALYPQRRVQGFLLSLEDRQVSEVSRG